MVPLKTTHSLIGGCATAEGTRRFRKKFSRSQPESFYRRIVDDMLVSALGFGTYLGECDDTEDERYTRTVVRALNSGVNLLDTAINYRCQRSERAIREALQNAIDTGSITRAEVVICTKGGYIPLERNPPATKDGYRAFLKGEYFDPGIMSPQDVVAGGHCLTPRYLTNQIERSKQNLGVASIDIYYLHNPEQQLDILSRTEFQTVIRSAFAALEDHVRAGSIRFYGAATWQGLRVSPESRNHLSLTDLVSIAQGVAGEEHHFKVIQLPINLAMTEAVRARTQQVGSDRLSVLEAAHRLGISVVGSATLMQAQLARALPKPLHAAFPGFGTDARRAIAFAQSLPVAAALVGMKSVRHLEQNLERAIVS